MSEWWRKYEGKFPGAGNFFPEEDWLSLKSVNGFKLMTYRFHIEIPRALVLTFHGMFSESNESAHLGKRLYEEGCAVLAFDQEGHGKSQGRKGNINGLKGFLQDSIKFMKKSIKRYPKVPVYLVGMSMGGTICTMLALKVPELISGMILLSPGLAVAPDLEPFLRKLLGCLNLCCGCLNLKKHDGTLVNRNKDYIEYYNENPYSYSGWTNAATAYSVLSELEELQLIWSDVNVPLVIIQGTVDKVVDAKMVELFYNQCKSSEKDLWVYEGMYHDVYHENEFFDILERLIGWINSRLDKDWNRDRII